MKNSNKAVTLFLEGYNCAQAVFGAFADVVGIEEFKALKLAAPFGGGIGRQREVCGACSGMLMAFGMLYGYESPETAEIKKEHYEKTRLLCNKFAEINGSIICRDILKTTEIGGAPSVRTEEYYKERPCERCVRTAAQILEEYIENN